MKEWEEKVILITGGAGGIGKAAAKRFLEAGAKVYLCGRHENNLQKAIEELEEFKNQLDYLLADITKVMECKQLIESTVKKAGRLDVVVNGAGIWVEGNADEMTEEMWDQTIDVNLKGTFFVCSYAIPQLEKTQGCIVNISSDAGIVGNAGASIYCASKGGITLLTKSLALELAPRQIRVNAVAPGDVWTPMLEKSAREHEAQGEDPENYYKALLSHYPQGKHARFIKAEEVAEAIYFLASPKTKAITGTILSMDFGLTAGY